MPETPQNSLPELVDCHAHLDMCGDPEQTLKEAAAAGLVKILAVGINLESSKQAVSLAAAHPQVFAAVGIHPHEAANVNDHTMAELEKLAAYPRVVAIGETGLDFYRNHSPRKNQTEVFLRHIELARKAGLALIVHARDAAVETLKILEKKAAGLTIILHCFSLYDQLEECVQRGYYISVAGNVTFPKALNLRQLATKIPDHLILTETDSPYLTPVPFRGEPNRPAYVRFVAAELARLRNMPAKKLAAQTLKNFNRAFGTSQ